MVMFSIIPTLAVLVPALGALLIACTGERRANLREFWSVATGVVMFALVASLGPDVLAGRDPSQLIAAEELRAAGGGTLTEQLLGLNLQPTMAGALQAPPGNTDFLRHMTPAMRRNAVRELLNKQREQMRRLVMRLQNGSDDQRRRDDRGDEDLSSADGPRAVTEMPTARECLQLATAARMLCLVEELLAMQDYTFSRMGTFSKG